MRNPTCKGRALGCQSGKDDIGESTAHQPQPQAAVAAIEAGLTLLPDACDLAVILRRRLDQPQRLWLAASALLALPADTAEELAEAVKADAIASMRIPTDRVAPTPELERERQRRAWVAYSRTVTRRARR